MNSSRSTHMASLLALGLMTLGLMTPAAHAALVSGNAGLVTRMYVYATFGNGDVAFYGTAIGSCMGFWLRPTDPGFKNMYAVLLAARAAGRPVQVSGYDNEIWNGSGSAFCRADSIDFAD
jgi:hypothetical protein